jgi:hypothetical protein
MLFGRIKRQRRRGILLLDLMVYCGLLAVVIALIGVVFNTALTQAGKLRRNIADIERAEKAGERWRADIRSATAPIKLDSTNLFIPQREGTIVYHLLPKEIRRQGQPLLTGVSSSEMQMEQRGDIVGWRWEVQLEQREKHARVHPLFTFMAVSGNP